MNDMGRFDGLLAIDRILKIFKIVFNCNSLGVTYNEFIIILTISQGNKDLKEISKKLLIDKGQSCKTLKSLVEKEIIEKDKKSCSYHLTKIGEKFLINSIEMQNCLLNEDFKDIPKELFDETKGIVIKLEKIMSDIYLTSLEK